MNLLGTIAHSFLKGFVDSFRGILVLFYLDRNINKQIGQRSPSNEKDTPGKSRSNAYVESKVLKRTLQCCTLNGGIFWCSIIMFEYGLLPLAKIIIFFTFRNNEENGFLVWSWLQSALSLIFRVIWVMPLFLLSKVVNSLWFQDIADSAYRYRRGRPQALSSFSKIIADTLFSILVQTLFLMQSMLVSSLPIPFLGYIFSLIHISLLYSLYSFEYKWINGGWELHKRLTFLEENWAYFIGFGLPLTLLTQMASSYIVSGCIFSILFPLFILSANEVAPVTDACEFPLKLFSPVIAISNSIFNKTVGSNRPQGTR